VVRLWAGWPRNCDSTSSRGSGFSCFKSIQMGVEAQLSFFIEGARGSFSGRKATGA